MIDDYSVADTLESSRDQLNRTLSGIVSILDQLAAEDSYLAQLLPDYRKMAEWLSEGSVNETCVWTWWFIGTLFALQTETHGPSEEAFQSRLNADFGHLADEAGLSVDEVFGRFLALSTEFAAEWLDERRVDADLERAKLN